MTDPTQGSPRAFALFDELVELPAAERAAALERLAVEDESLFREVAGLLAADAAAGDFLDRPVLDESPLLDESPTLAFDLDARGSGSPSPSAGGLVGAWRLVRPLGAGGMGEVWEVERADGQFDQRAALKLLKRGLDSEAILDRFRAERQILARLRHPAIAHLYDGGLAPDGRPFYVMELVDGEEITTACARRGLAVEEMLQVFLEVCDAVEAAHRALVVHRDLKPSNVLLTAGGGIKLLDFGIAKLLDPDDPGANATREWERLLTPAYAAPEQILGEPVTTATDVYSLGVMLYELLTGRLPHDRRVSSAARLVEEVTSEIVERPSTAVRREPAVATDETFSAGERVRRSRRLRGDLDWIVLRALAREPERRYPGAAALAADLRRHLARQPVEARPDSTLYRAGRFARRHRAAVAAGILVAISLLVGLGAALWQAREAQAHALRAEREAAHARQQTERARREAAKALGIADFLKTMILEANPLQRSGSAPMTLMEVVQTGAERAEEGLEGEPELQAQMLIFFGDLAITMEEWDRATALVERAHQIATTSPGVDDLVWADSHGSLGVVRMQAGDPVEAERLFRAGLGRLDQRLSRDPDDEPAMRLQSTLSNLYSQLLMDLGRHAEATALVQQAVEVHRRLDGPQSAEVAKNLFNLAMANEIQGKLEQAETQYREARTIALLHYAPDDPRMFFVNTGVADVLVARGKLDEALQIQHEALVAARAGFGDRHSLVATGLYNIASTQLAQGHLAEARPGLEECLRLAEDLDAGRPEGMCARQLAYLTLLEGDEELALAAYRRARESTARVHGEANHVTVGLDIRIAQLQAGQSHRKRAGEVQPALRELEEAIGRLGPDAPPEERMLAGRLHAQVLSLAGREEEAEQRLREAVNLGERELGRDALATSLADLDLARHLLASADAGELADGRSRAADAIARLERLGRGWLPQVSRARQTLAAPAESPPPGQR
jgi:serine/threonine protein kinase